MSFPSLSIVCVLLSWIPIPALATVTPAPGYAVTIVSPLNNSLGFNSMVGVDDANGNRLVVTRDAIDPMANHQVLSVDPSGTDTIISTQAQYPIPDRLFGQMQMDPSGPNSMFVLDIGSISLCDINDTDGRLFRFDVPTGNFTLLAGGFYDPLGMDLDPISGDLFIADRGCSTAPVDGEIARWDGTTLSTVPLSVKHPLDLVFLSDGTYYLQGELSVGSAGIFHVSGSTVLGTYDSSLLGNGQLAYHDGSGSMPAGLYATGERAPDPFGVYWLPDDDADFVADQVVFVAELDDARIEFDSQGRVLVVDRTTDDLVAISTAIPKVPAVSWLGGLTLGVVLMLVGVSTHARRRC